MVDRDAREKLVVVSCKLRESRRHLLEAIQKERRHEGISETMREAIESYIDAHFSRPRNVA